MRIFNILTIVVYLAWFAFLFTYPVQTIASLLVTLFLIVNIWKSDYKFVLLNALENNQVKIKSKGKREDDFNPPI